jgi:hypothetical protein
MLLISFAKIRIAHITKSAQQLVAVRRKSATLSSVLVDITQKIMGKLFIVKGFGVMKATEILVAHLCPNATV